MRHGALSRDWFATLRKRTMMFQVFDKTHNVSPSESLCVARILNVVDTTAAELVT